MPNYWMTFRIKQDASYDDRYDGMMSAIEKVRQGIWAEPTSFMFVESHLEIGDLVRTAANSLNPKTDVLVARYIDKDGSRYFGAVEHLDVLKSFLPNIKKV